MYIRHICNLFCNLEKKKKTPQQFRKPAVSLSTWLSLLSPCRCSAEPASSCQGGRPTGQRWEWWRPRCPRARCPSDRLLSNHTGRHSSAQGSTEGFAVNRKRFYLFCPASYQTSTLLPVSCNYDLLQQLSLKVGGLRSTVDGGLWRLDVDHPAVKDWVCGGRLRFFNFEWL